MWLLFSNESIKRSWEAVLLLSVLTAGQALSQNGSAAPVDPAKIVRDASWNELHAPSSGHSFSYRQYKVDPKGTFVKQLVETKDGDVARLMERDGKPLSPDQEQAEADRLNNLLAHPEIQEHRHKREQEDSARGDEMVRMLPDAFLIYVRGHGGRPEWSLLPAGLQAQSRLYPT